MIIVFEGMDGAGKTTLIKSVQDALPIPSIHVTYHETELGKSLFQYMKHNKLHYDLSQAFLFTAVIQETLAELKMDTQPRTVFLLDRYTPSTLAYQYNAVKEDYAAYVTVMQNRLILTPDITYYLRITPEEAAKRKEAGTLDLLELKNRSIVYENYENILHQHPTLDATESIESLTATCVKDIMHIYYKMFEVGLYE